MRIVFIGESWQGSSARSLREALVALPDVTIEDIGHDRFVPAHRTLPLRIANRLLRPLQIRELEEAIRRTTAALRPDAVVVYKGIGVRAPMIRELQAQGHRVINVFPDYSPHAYGPGLRDAVGEYDLVISTKPFHPPMWQSVYHYTNPCVCVPHGYDPQVHLWHEPPAASQYDVAFCGSWRPEYGRLMKGVAAELPAGISVALAGTGWAPHLAALPPHWRYAGPQLGRAYGEFLRSAKIALAPVNSDVVINGVRQPGDEDTTRTYELASAYCFFLHQRTPFVETLYDSAQEVPLWNDAAELAALIVRWLPDEAGRRRMAERAHARAVPAYSIPSRADEVLKHIARAVAGARA